MGLSDRIASDLSLDREFILLSAERNGMYKKYQINKNHGKGKREILHPSKELKVIQRWLADNFFYDFPVSEYCTAYVKGASTKKSVSQHLESNFFLHSDIKKFFESIDRLKLERLINKNTSQMQESDMQFVLDACLYRGRQLTIGGVSSPAIANCIMHDFDEEIGKLVAEFDGVYTRYSDDILISSRQYIDPIYVKKLKIALEKYGFEMNNEKTYFSSRSGKIRTVGLTIDNNCREITIGHENYVSIKKKIYKVLGSQNMEEIIKVKGYLSYIKSISPKQYMQLKNIYSKYDNSKLIFK